jgi:hypothetical protein
MSSSGSVILFPRHKIEIHSGECDCIVCRGGLFICDTCKCAEGELPTHCPQEYVPHDVREDLMDGLIDFVDGKWITLKRRDAK